MKLILAFIFILQAITQTNSKEIKITARQLFSNRLNKWVYFTKTDYEDIINTVNRTDTATLNDHLTFSIPDDSPDYSREDIADSVDVDWLSSDLICISNTFAAFIFTVFTFSSACSIVIAIQLTNYKTKEEREYNAQSKLSN